MAFCINCGQELAEGANFCANCGREVKNNSATKRKMVYEGELHKCPNCGEVLDSFITNCPTCGYEIRNIKAASAVQELTRKLELIESQKMPVVSIEPITPFSVPKSFEQEPKSTMKRLFGWDFNESQRREAQQEAIELEKKAREQELNARIKDARIKEKKFQAQKDREKANLIQNFPIPNTKEDILEFALLVSANINAKNAVLNVVSKAWMAKLNQVYQKAEISFNGNSDFEKIRSIYQQVYKRWKRLQIFCVFKKAIIFFIKNLTTWLGLIAFLIAIRMDQAGDNSSGIAIIGMILMITSAAILHKRKANYLEFIVVALSGVLLLALEKFMVNGSGFELTGIIVLIIVAYNFIKSIIKRDL